MQQQQKLARIAHLTCLIIVTVINFSQKYCLLSISKGALMLIVHCGSLSNNSSSFYSTHHEK